MTNKQIPASVIPSMLFSAVVEVQKDFLHELHFVYVFVHIFSFYFDKVRLIFKCKTLLT